MHNKVVYRLARGLRKTGCVVLRFNYRGVNLSEGEYDHGIGETEDARIALRELPARYPDLPLLAAGFSFGSRVALALDLAGSRGPARHRGGISDRVAEREFVYQVQVPKYFVHSTHDEFGPQPELAAFFETLPGAQTTQLGRGRRSFFQRGARRLRSGDRKNRTRSRT